MKSFYLPLNAACLADYFGSACIKPSSYYAQRPRDIQSPFTSHLLLTTRKGVQGSTCCLEVVLADDEAKECLNIAQGFFCFPKPLPVSRVKGVLFDDKEQEDLTIAALHNGTAFVPRELVRSVESFEAAPTVELLPPNSVKTKDYREQAARFDRWLGGLALMRLAGEDYMNYADGYFGALSFFNEKIEEELDKAKRTTDRRFHDAFLGQGHFKVLYEILQREIATDDVERMAAQEKQEIVRDKITRLIDLTRLENATYLLATLQTYGAGSETKKRRVDELILSNFRAGIKPEKSQVVALCYGLNRGYSIFSNIYRTSSRTREVKYRLDSLLDYYTIESVYQFAFYGRRTTSLPYLEDWCPRRKRPGRLRSNQYMILDVVVDGKKKPQIGSREYFEELFQRYFKPAGIELFRPLVEKLLAIFKEDYDLQDRDIVEDLRETIAELEQQKKQLADDKELLSTKVKSLQEQLSSSRMATSPAMQIAEASEKDYAAKATKSRSSGEKRTRKGKGSQASIKNGKTTSNSNRGAAGARGANVEADRLPGI